jgi:hypothetical protein
VPTSQRPPMATRRPGIRRIGGDRRYVRRNWTDRRSSWVWWGLVSVRPTPRAELITQGWVELQAQVADLTARVWQETTGRPGWARGTWARNQTPLPLDDMYHSRPLQGLLRGSLREPTFLEVLFGSQAPRAFGMHFEACVVASRWDGPTEVDHDRSQGKPARS